MTRAGLAVVLGAILVFGGCDGGGRSAAHEGPATPRTAEARPERVAALEVTSSAFREGQTIPTRHTADGEDVAPPLAWTAPPAGTRSFALICDDPDAPSGTFVHWLAWNLPATDRGLGEAPTLAHQGRNGFGRSGYGGPSPPPGTPHHYRFQIFALDATLDLPDGSTRAELDRAMERHVLAQGTLTGRYGR